MVSRIDAPPCPVALLLGGVDPSCGAGVVRDALVAAALGSQPMVLPTAETLQNGAACLQIAAPALSPRLRLEVLAPHLTGTWGLKIGLLAMDLDDVTGLVSDLAALGPQMTIWDPVMAPTSGVSHHDGRALARLADRVLPALPCVVTPNRVEAAVLAETTTDADPQQLAQPWLIRGASAVWLKGGHAQGDAVEDVWVTTSGVQSLGTSPRLPGERRGTGCSLASAWLALRLRGMAAVEAAVEAAAWLRLRWDHAHAPGGLGRPMFGPEGFPW